MMGLFLLAAVLVLGPVQQAVLAAVVETPLPYGKLRHLQAPLGYTAQQCPPGAITIDGMLTEDCWRDAPATDEFTDIVGPTGPKPWFKTTAKLLWDQHNLYIAAELEDPRLFAHKTLHDSIIFHDNDFEVFIDPDGDNWMYYEMEVNANGAVWDLLLVRPYRNGGPPVMNWETITPAVPTMSTGPTGWQPAHVAVHVDGALNSQEGSQGWSVEMALPWSLLQQAANRRVPPAPGDRWRINFSRVHWNVTWDAAKGRYMKQPADQPGYNWVWVPQWQVQMHQPETWGYVEFSSQQVGQVSSTTSPYTSVPPDETWPARALLMDVYHAQTLCWQALKRFCTSLDEASEHLDLSDVTQQVSIQTTTVSFVASVEVQLADGTAVVVMVDQLSRLVQAPIASDSGLPQYNPFEGNSRVDQDHRGAAALSHPPDCAASNSCLQEAL